MDFLCFILVSTACAARRSRPKSGNIPVCVRYQSQNVRAAVAAAMEFGGAEVVAAGPPKRVETLRTELFNERWKPGNESGPSVLASADVRPQPPDLRCDARDVHFRSVGFRLACRELLLCALRAIAKRPQTLRFSRAVPALMAAVPRLPRIAREQLLHAVRQRRKRFQRPIPSVRAPPDSLTRALAAAPKERTELPTALLELLSGRTLPPPESRQIFRRRRLSH